MHFVGFVRRRRTLHSDSALDHPGVASDDGRRRGLEALELGSVIGCDPEMDDENGGRAQELVGLEREWDQLTPFARLATLGANPLSDLSRSGGFESVDALT